VRHFPRARPSGRTSQLGCTLISRPLRCKGIRRLYTHQAAAAEAVHAGKNVVIVTPTASGKTLCYNLPVLNAVLENSDSARCTSFPPKPSRKTSCAELHDLTSVSKTASAFSPTMAIHQPTPAKPSAKKSQSFLTNPDMLHTGILPHHTRWTRLFENLRYIVLDELHTYRGVFGSHLCNVLRRFAASLASTAAIPNSFVARQPSPTPATSLHAFLNPKSKSSIRTARPPRRRLSFSTIRRRKSRARHSPSTSMNPRA